MGRLFRTLALTTIIVVMPSLALSEKYPLKPVRLPIAAEEWNWAKYFSEMKCSTLFGSTVPKWISTVSDPGIFKNKLEWEPVCSAMWLKFSKKIDPSSHNQEGVNQFNRYLKKYDELKEENQDETTSNADASNKAIKALLTDNERAKKLEVMNSVIESVGNQCCEKNEDCEIDLKKIKVTFYDSEDKDGRTEYHVGNHSDWHERFANLSLKQQAKIALNTFPVPVGHITLSPFQNDDDLNALIHEAIHACSFIKRDNLARNGNTDAIQAYVGRLDCQANSGTRSFFNKLFKGLGLNSKSIECIEEIASKAPQGRFDPSQKTGGCERAYLEESYAFVGADTNPMNIADFKTQAEGLCLGKRDNIHPLAADIFRCELLTPDIKKQFIAATGCRK